MHDLNDLDRHLYRWEHGNNISRAWSIDPHKLIVVIQLRHNRWESSYVSSISSKIFVYEQRYATKKLCKTHADNFIKSYGYTLVPEKFSCMI